MLRSPYVIGRPGKPVRALAFSGGGYNTALQLGVAHALLVSRGRDPDIVVGVSAGAANAVALAEILQAGGPASGSGKLAAQAARFRQILEAFRAAPGQLFGALLPDPYQINAEKPLAPARLPIHAARERRERQEATAARDGLIRLANDLLGLRLTVGTATRILRAVLGLQASVETRPRWRGVLEFLSDGLRLWLVTLRNVLVLAPVAQRLTGALISQLRLVQRALAAAAGTVEGTPWRAAVRWVLGWDSGGTAGGLIFRAAPRRWIAHGVRYGIGLALMILLLVVGAPLALLALAPPIRRLLAPLPSWMTRRFFASYDVADGLFGSHPLRELFVRLFDPGYYGTIRIEGVIENALRDSAEQSRTRPTPKRLSTYLTGGSTPIRVGPIAADVATGDLVVLPECESVVDALRAAVAVPPAFAPVDLAGRFYVDGSIVANEPTRSLIEELRRPGMLHPDAPIVHVYPVSDLPLSRTELDDVEEPKEFTRIVDIASRALLLQRFRDATLDRRMTELYTSVLPKGRAICHVASGAATRDFVRAYVYPIEPESPPDANTRVLRAGDEQARRQVVAETVADGCRAALQAMVRRSIESVAQGWASVETVTKGNQRSRVVSCAAAIRARLPPGTAALPGREEGTGPGVVEVCRACALHRGDPSAERKQTLRVADDAVGWPEWPRFEDAHEEEGDFVAPQGNQSDASTDDSLRALTRAAPPGTRQEGGAWPRDRYGLAGDDRPLVSLIFSGGVFRGVFLMGVVNALNELGLEPDIIAGSSVGSISAAMTARVFSIPPAAAGKRRLAIANLASTFLAIDRLILTDRFADFVRNVTLRAAETDFSLRHADRVFRCYDRGTAARFSKDFRRVLAGLERLLYVNPFEVRDLTEALRRGRHGRAFRMLREFAQEWLEKGGVGLELLGAEPLELLITEHVIGPELAAPGVAPRLVPMDGFLGNGIFFMATATNLTCGRLEVLGAHQYRGPEFEAKLLDALLASSAFPGVFRPRWSWEVMPQSHTSHQYIDGGVMDNLPLDAIAYFLDSASRQHLVARRPKAGGRPVPHLLFTASLEVDPPALAERQVKQLVGSWPAVAARAKQLSYNKKLDAYQKMQESLRFIRTALPDPDAYDPLDLEVVAIKPKWLCGTFALHPMLGFRRARQAESIAHGCASTLDRFRVLGADPTTRHWMSAWGIQPAVLQGTAPLSSPGLTPERRKTGTCWFRKDAVCPFSRPGLLAAGMPESRETTIQEVESIHRACGHARTHLARA